MSSKENPANNSVVIGLALISGLGLTLMTTALAIGSIQGESASTTTIGLLFFTGLVMLFGGIGGWFGVVRPHEHFDDIDVPAYTGHHEEDEH